MSGSIKKPLTAKVEVQQLFYVRVKVEGEKRWRVLGKGPDYPLLKNPKDALIFGAGIDLTKKFAWGKAKPLSIRELYAEVFQALEVSFRMNRKLKESAIAIMELAEGKTAVKAMDLKECYVNEDTTMALIAVSGYVHGFYVVVE